MFPNIIQQRVERSIFEVIRKNIVGQGLLPDITNSTLFPTSGGIFTPQAQTNWNNAVDQIRQSLQYCVEIFGTSSSFAKRLKAVPRVVIVTKRIIPGDIGLPPGSSYSLDPNTQMYTKSEYPPESSNFHFDIHLLSGNQEQSRFLNMLLSVSLGTKKYIEFEDSPSERFFIKHYNYYDVSDNNDGIEENVYSYEVQDLYLFSGIGDTQISPIKQIETDIIMGYNDTTIKQVIT